MERSASKNILSLEPSTAFFPRRTNQPLPATSPQAGGTSSPAPPPAAAPPPRRRSDPPSCSPPQWNSTNLGGGARALRPRAQRIAAAALELCGLELGGSWWRRSSSPASTSADLVSRAQTPGLELGGSRWRNSARLGIGPAGRLPPRHLPPKNRPGGHAARRLRPSSGRALLPPRPPPLLLS